MVMLVQADHISHLNVVKREGDGEGGREGGSEGGRVGDREGGLDTLIVAGIEIHFGEIKSSLARTRTVSSPHSFGFSIFILHSIIEISRSRQNTGL